MSLRDRLTERILALAGVETRPSRFADAQAFWTGRREFAHFHDDRTIDIRLTRKMIRAMRADLADDPRVTLRGGSDWLEFTFARASDVDRAAELAAAALAANRV